MVATSARVADSVLPQEAHGEGPELPSVYYYLDIVMVLTQVAIAGAHHFWLAALVPPCQQDDVLHSSTQLLLPKMILKASPAQDSPTSNYSGKSNQVLFPNFPLFPAPRLVR